MDDNEIDFLFKELDNDDQRKFQKCYGLMYIVLLILNQLLYLCPNIN